jgi:thiol-disulfide isomerase/thioredoxin
LGQPGIDIGDVPPEGKDSISGEFKPKENPMSCHRLFFALAIAVIIVTPLARSAEDTHVKGPAPAHIAMGQEVAIADYLVPGKTTVVDFYSEFCPDCRVIAPKLAELHKNRADIAVVKVDINRPGVKGIDWKSPVAQQYKLHSIPQIEIFGPDGKLQAEGDAAYDQVVGWAK